MTDEERKDIPQEATGAEEPVAPERPNDSGTMPGQNSYPDPPAGWNQSNQPSQQSPQGNAPQDPDLPDMGVVGRTVFKLTDQEAFTFSSARKFITASQVAAVVSLIVGGVLLSSIAVVLAIIGFRKLNDIAQGHTDQIEVHFALRRSGILAIGISAAALIINVVSLIFFYPMVMESLGAGGFGGLFPSGTSAAPSPTTGSAPGVNLFG